MKLSIITVNLNNSAGLEATIASVFMQSYQDYEYIVIDGGSNDGSTDVLERSSGGIDYWISEPDQGVYHAMNKGIDRASGDYLLFLNSGDRLLAQDTLLNVAGGLNGTDIVYGNLRYDRVHHFYDAEYPDKLSISYLFEYYLPHPATFIKRTLFDSIGKYDVSYPICADWAFFMKSLGLYQASYRHINQIISVYDTQGMSAQSENQPAIQAERRRFLNTEFPLFSDDLISYIKLKKQLTRFEKGWRKKIVRLLGLKIEY